MANAVEVYLRILVMSASSFRGLIAMGLEAAPVDGKQRTEIEYVFYGRMKDPGQLAQAVQKEVMEQWLLPLENATNGRKLRMRSIDNRRFILTAKEKRTDTVGCFEVECDISKDMFNLLKKMAVGGQKKTRYSFPAEGGSLTWEIDVFQNIQGDDSPWVKIDLEVESANQPVPKLPLDFDELITNQPGQYSQEEAAFIDQLWKKEWVELPAPTE